VFAATSASCHGEDGKGGAAPRLAGGIGAVVTGSYWPYATTLFD
jgi:hypothetical protein